MARDTYKYHFKKGNKIVHTGITNDLERREQEHKRWSGRTGLILIRRPCMTGPNISLNFSEWRSAGLLLRRRSNLL